VLPVDTINLPACAFGAGIAHAAALALVLPMMITLPAPSESSTAKLVAIPVTIVADAGSAPDLIGALMDEPAPVDEVVSEPVAPAEVTPDNDDDIITAALPAPEPAAAPEQMSEPEPERAAVEPAEAEPAESEPELPVPLAVAATEAAMPPLPTRVRRDDNGEAILRTPPVARPPVREPVQAAKPARRAVTAQKRGFFGLAKPSAPKVRAKDAAPYKGSWEALLGKPAH
jgi:hypothetical protein